MILHISDGKNNTFLYNESETGGFYDFGDSEGVGMSALIVQRLKAFSEDASAALNMGQVVASRDWQNALRTKHEKRAPMAPFSFP